MKYITRSIGIRMMICFGLIGMWGSVLPMAESAEAGPVSYTHLTLPTSDLV